MELFCLLLLQPRNDTLKRCMAVQRKILYVCNRSILVLLAGSKSDNLFAKISSIEVSPTDGFWHYATVTSLKLMSAMSV
jgi:hypothetical protein